MRDEHEVSHAAFTHRFRSSSHGPAVAIAFLTLLIAAWLVYQAGLPGFFMLDDFDNLGALQDGVTDLASLQNYLGNGNAGPLGRPIAKLSFLLDDVAWPSNPDGFKRTNILIHILIGVLIVASSRLLLRRVAGTRAADWLALVTAGLWLLHPLQVSTVLYVVQRMTQLSALFVMAGVLSHLYLRLHSDLSPRTRAVAMTFSLGCFTILAAFSKESGILLPVYLAVAEYTLLDDLPRSTLLSWWRRLCLLAPTGALIGYIAYLPNWSGSYSTRDFTLAERLMTEPVVLLDYLSSLFSLRVHGLGLFQDDYPVYSSLLSPLPLIAALAVLAALTAALLLRRRLPLFSFAVLWFLGGHLLESTTVSLELYFEHRNYLPLVGPLLALPAAAHLTLRKYSPDLAKVAPVFALGLVGLVGSITWGYASEWREPLRILSIWAAEHPDSPRAQRTFAHLLASEGLPGAALDVLGDAYQSFPTDLSIPIISLDISCRFEKPLRHDLAELRAAIPSHQLTDGLRPALQSLFAAVKERRCLPDTTALHQFVHSLTELPGVDKLPRAMAGFLVLDGELYLAEGNGNAALQSFQDVDRIQPSTDSALRIAGFYLLVRDYDRARAALELAQARERAGSNWFSPDRSQEYQEKFELIDRLEAALQASRRNSSGGQAD